MGVNSPLVWVGGKAAWADWLASLLPPHGMYVEVFAGGASVLLAKQPSKTEVYNDLDADLVNLFNVLRDKDSADRLTSMFRFALVSRSTYERLLAIDPAWLLPVERAFRYLYVNRASFSGHMRRPAMSVGADGPNTLALWVEHAEEHIDQLWRRLHRCYIECMDFRQLLPYYDKMKSSDGTVFFLDPPYMVKDAAYVHWFTEQDHIDLHKAVCDLQGKWLMTINDCSFYREHYRHYHIKEKVKAYSVANKKQREHGELIISNYPLPEVVQGTLFVQEA